MAITNRGIGIKYPLMRSSIGAFEVNRTTIDAVRDSLRILILTNHGERVINYNLRMQY
jgi:phage baseplate assembly protein W